MAMRRASERKTSGGASPARPMKTRAEPRGLMIGSRALKAMRKELQSSKTGLRGIYLIVRCDMLYG